MNEQPDPNRQRLEAVDSATLTPLVCKALNNTTLTVTDWKYEQIHGGFGGGIGGTFVYRFSGKASDQADMQDWSLILKIIHARPDDEPNSTHYWKREYEIYRSGWIDNLPGQFCAATCYGAVEYPDEACWIWQEDVKDAIGDTWELKHHGITAQHLGQFNGAYLTGQKIPEADWLGTNWLRNITRHVETNIPQIQQILAEPVFKPYVIEQFTSFWNTRERFLNALDQLPQTFAHQDPVRRNLFLRKDSGDQFETVAIDWAYVGQAPVGLEIGVSFLINIIMDWVDFSDAAELETLLYDGYLSGLRDAGWKGNAQQVRLGFINTIIFKYIEVTGVLPNWYYQLEEQKKHDEQARAVYQAFIEVFHPMHDLIFAFVDEAQTLMDELDY